MFNATYLQDWQKIQQIVITVLTAIATTLGTTSCIKLM
ncbi:MAG: smalltalk protein [Bacteroidaceae bacterium]|nr:smalltalk protein [Bacteroidaceae bacterium]